MGMNRVKLAIAVALAEHGGRLSTPELVASLGEGVAGTTIARNLNELEDHGYVTGDVPRGDRRRRRTHWTLNHAKLHADLLTLICCVLLVHGSWRQVVLGMEDMAPVTGIPMGIIQAALLVASIGMSLVLAHSLWRQATGRMPSEELVPTHARSVE